jgi:3'(2'), 5'-bisphosphate nucleotidase
MAQPVEFERRVAVLAEREAAALCRAVRGGIEPASLVKADRTTVTVADFGSQALIARALTETFPSDPVTAEEDPVDLRRPEAAGLLDLVLGACLTGSANARSIVVLQPCRSSSGWQA